MIPCCTEGDVLVYSAAVSSLATQVNGHAMMFLAQQQEGGPLGPEHGKASPIGLLVMVLLLAVVLYLGWAFHRRYSRYNRRRIFAEKHGIDVFDEEAVDKAMDEAGVLDRKKKHWL